MIDIRLPEGEFPDIIDLRANRDSFLTAAKRYFQENYEYNSQGVCSGCKNGRILFQDNDGHEGVYCEECHIDGIITDFIEQSTNKEL